MGRESLTGLMLLLPQPNVGRKELSGRTMIDVLPQGLLDKLAGLDTFGSNKPLRLDFTVALIVDCDFYSLVQSAPPTWTVNFTEPLSSLCSIIECPLRRASIFAFSTA